MKTSVINKLQATFCNVKYNPKILCYGDKLQIEEGFENVFDKIIIIIIGFIFATIIS